MNSGSGVHTIVTHSLFEVSSSKVGSVGVYECSNGRVGVVTLEIQISKCSCIHRPQKAHTSGEACHLWAMKKWEVVSFGRLYIGVVTLGVLSMWSS